MRNIFSWGLVLAMLIVASGAAAQEVQVPIDQEGRVEVVDAELARRAGLWVSEYPGFREARLFRAPDGGLVLEISEEREGRLLRHRLPLTPAEADEVRRRVSSALAAAPGAPIRPQVDQEGRNLLIGQTTLAGVLYYGWALPYAFDSNETSAGGLYLITAAASFFVPFWLTADQRVTTGMANLSRYGVSRGIVHGWLMGEVLETATESTTCDPVADPDCIPRTDNEDRLSVGLGMAASIAEGVAGYAWARNTNMTPGTAHTVALGGDVGLATGLLSSVVVDLDDGGFRAGAAMGLAGAALGIYGGRALAERRAYTWGDAQVMYAGGLTGAVSGGAAAEVLGASPEVGAASTILSGWIGLAVTDGLVRDMDFAGGEANLVMLSAFAGSLAGAGVGVIMENDDVATAGSAAGAIAGFALGYGSFASRRGARAIASRGPLDIQIHPAGVAGLLSGGLEGPRPAGLVSASYRF